MTLTDPVDTEPADGDGPWRVEPPARRWPRPGARTVSAVVVSLCGLAALTVAQVLVVGPRVADDLGRRSREALADAGITTVAVRVHGRDVALTGTATDARQAFVAEHVVDTVDGVRYVDTSGLVVGGPAKTPSGGPSTPTATPTAGPTVSPSRTPGQPPAATGTTLPGTGADSAGTTVVVVADGGKALLAGAFPSTADRSKLRSALRATFTTGGVTTQTATSSTAGTVGVDAVGRVLAALGPDAQAVTVALDGGRITVAARVADAAKKTGALTAAATAVSGSAAVVDRITVGPLASSAPGSAVAAALDSLPVLTFGQDQTTPGPVGRSVLAAAAFLLDADRTASVTLVGYTDGTGDTAADARTSLARATESRSYLGTLGVSRSRVAVSGLGSAAAPGATAATGNRRVVVRGSQ